MQKRSITIKDLARHLGISKSTVSRALRGHPSVKEATRQAVLALAEAWDYTPDKFAVGLAHKQTFTLGIVIPNISFPYFSLALSGAQEIASKAGYQVMICQSNESLEAEKAVIRTLVANRVDGMLISISQETDRYEHLHALVERGIPFVLFDRITEAVDVPKVVVNNYRGACEATRHLIAQGYRRIAHLAGPLSLLVSQQRLAGYRAALEEHKLPLEEALVVETGFRMRDGERACKQLLALSEVPDAILAVSDSAAIGAKRCLEAQGLRIPHDMALMGFNDEPIAQVASPGLSSVALPMHALGQEALRLLLHRISYPHEPAPSQQKVLATRLVVRASSKT